VSDTFPARRSQGGDAAAPIAGVLLLLALAMLVLGGSRDPGPAMLALTALAAVLAAAGIVALIVAIAYRRLAYSLTESALRIEWLGSTVVVPYAAIQGIYTGQRLSGHAVPRAVRWPGISVGQTRVRGLGRLRFFATSTNQADLTLVTVEHGGVIISARDPSEFRAALIDHVERHGEPLPGKSELPLLQHKNPVSAPWTALADLWLPVCILVGAVALLVVLAGISLSYDSLPDRVILHFDAEGDPSQIAPKSDLLRLPLLGFVCLLLNWVLGVWVHAREPVLARLLWLGGVGVQIVLLVGVLRLLA
jgi:hypothetical protein